MSGWICRWSFRFVTSHPKRFTGQEQRSAAVSLFKVVIAYPKRYTGQAQRSAAVCLLRLSLRAQRGNLWFSLSSRTQSVIRGRLSVSAAISNLNENLKRTNIDCRARLAPKVSAPRR